jgi:hypothetical protein
MAYASITSADLAEQLYGFDHAALPSSLDVDGIEIRLDAYKDETGGSGVLKLRVRLSWDGGTSWTSAKTTGPITSAIATYTLGGATDTWGHAWTRAQLQSPVFRIEVMSKGTSIIDNPEWRVDYVAPRLYFTNTTSLTLDWSERVQVVETDNFEWMEPLLWSEHVSVTDSGSGLADGLPRVQFSGDVIDEIQSTPASFQSASSQSNTPHGIGAFFLFSGLGVGIGGSGVDGVALFDGLSGHDPAGATRSGGTYTLTRDVYYTTVTVTAAATIILGPYHLYYSISFSNAGGSIPGISRTLAVAESALVEPGAIFQQGLVELGDIIVEGAPAVEIQSHEATIIIRNTALAAGSTVDSITQYLRDCYVIGQQVYIYIYAKEGTGWLSRLAFEGVVVGFETTPETVEFRCQDMKKDLIELPVLEVGPGAMNYGVDEGKLPDASFGLVVPIAIGRFDATAVKDWGSTGIFDPSNGLASILPHLLGVKVPCAPLTLAADRYLRRSGSAHAQTMRQALLVVGDRNTPTIQLSRPLNGLRYPTSAGQFQDTTPGSQWRIYYESLFSWNSELDRAQVFVSDQSVGYDATEKLFAGCGSWVEQEGDPTGPTYPLAKADAFYVNRTNPKFVTETGLWPGSLAAIALAPERQAEILGSLYSGHAVGTTAGVLDVEECYTGDPETYARIPVGQTLSVEFSRDAPRLGDVFAMRACVVLHESTSPELHAEMRFAKYSYPVGNSEPAMPLGVAICRPDINFVAGTTAFDLKLVGSKFGSIKVIDPRFPWPGNHWHDWRFVQDAYDPTTGTGQVTEQPWTLTLWALSAEARVIHCWVEVIYKPRLAGAVIGSALGPANEIPWHKRQQLPGGGPRNRRIAPQPEDPQNLDRLEVFASCHATALDDAVGKYTGVAGAIVESPTDSILFLLDKYVADYVARATGTNFGSFERARDQLNLYVGGGAEKWRLSILQDEKTTWGALRAQIATQGLGFCEKQVSATGYEWRYFVDCPRPDLEAPERYYRAGAKLFEVLDLAPDQGSFRVIPQPLDELASQFQLNYGWHPPTRKYAYKKFVSATADNLESLGANYRAACAQTETRYGIRRKFSVDAPWVWSHKVADQLCKWYCNLRRDRRLTVEFLTYLPYCDLQPGHVIRFADSMATLVKYHGLDGSSAWSGHYFNVLSATIVKGPDSPLMVRVVAQEVYSVPA